MNRAPMGKTGKKQTKKKTKTVKKGVGRRSSLVTRDSGNVERRAEPAPSGVEGRNDLVRVKLSEVHENGMIGTYDL